MNDQRKRINEHKDKAVGMFGVLRMPRGSKTARFASLHESQSSARVECMRLAGEGIERYGMESDTLYFVVEIKSAHGIVDGKFHGAV